MVSNADGLDRVVEASLDLAPPGYQEWRLGHKPGTWRTFVNQLSTGNPKINTAGIGLPLESALTGPLPYDCQHADIPLRFVGPRVASLNGRSNTSATAWTHRAAKAATRSGRGRTNVPSFFPRATR